ncbi:shikimate dehydrogenase [Corynebacterium glaucum]|uniref:shikimate dehydrogenase n=1 Tax=Corynebacterium glaucum TaxID=187491 RepID=UPI0025B5BF05|nr:shikimate dehydrogenase [Corynebacterium glaucum]WJZ07847.1 Shikimate dehydrogenase [Corynebacterium glaucum]
MLNDASVDPGHANPGHRAAVLGSPIAHSLSPVLHNSGYLAAGLADWSYTRIECTGEDLARIVGEAGPEFRGFSVTMPAKFAALEFADEVTERARAIGSANTLVRIDPEKLEAGWRADNTDCEGLLAALDELTRGEPIRSAVVVGAGGTARPALWALAQLGVERIHVLNRSDRAAELADLTEGIDVTFSTFDTDIAAATVAADVVVSTVPSQAIEAYVNDLAHAPVLDVIYDPWPTPLSVRAASHGYNTVGGLVMLAAQSYSQFEQFTGVPAPREAMREALFAHVASQH